MIPCLAVNMREVHSEILAPLLLWDVGLITALSSRPRGYESSTALVRTNSCEDRTHDLVLCSGLDMKLMQTEYSLLWYVSFDIHTNG